MEVIKKREINKTYTKKGVVFEIDGAVLNRDGLIEVGMDINNERRYARPQDGQILTFWDVKIGKQKVNGVKIEDKEVWDKIMEAVNELKSEYERMRQEDLAYIPEKVEVAEGEETASLYVFVDTPNGVEMPQIVQDMEKKLNGLRHKMDIYNILKDLSEEGYAKRITDTGHFLALWDFEVDFSKLASKVGELWEEKVGKKIREEKERRERLRKLAQETGEPQELYRYTDDCNDPKLDCDLDIITVYVYPDGHIGEERTHTF